MSKLNSWMESAQFSRPGSPLLQSEDPSSPRGAPYLGDGLGREKVSSKKWEVMRSVNKYFLCVKSCDTV